LKAGKELNAFKHLFTAAFASISKDGIFKNFLKMPGVPVTYL